MRIFVYEHITGGGLFGDQAAPLPRGSLLAEGRAMVQAITADLIANPNTIVSTTRDARLPPLHPPGCEVAVVHSAGETHDSFLRLASSADWTLLIAPETDGVLAGRARFIESTGGRLLSPPAALIEIAANKQHTADWLGRHKVPVPSGWTVVRGVPQRFPRYPAVLKPVDGCGSHEVRLIRSPAEFANAVHELTQPNRLEEFIPGLAVSVAALCGPADRVSLPACQQRLSNDGQFRYFGGSTPLPGPLDRRARRLALAAVGTLPGPLGYIGVDLVLGEQADGSGDCVIEINPRLTTSYVGLRQIGRENLAAAMLAIATGRPATLSFHAGPVEFDADGTIRSSASRGNQASAELARWKP